MTAENDNVQTVEAEASAIVNAQEKDKDESEE